MAGIFDIYNALASVNSNNPALGASNPTFAQSGSGLFTPGGGSTLGDVAAMASPVGAPGAMDVALARAAGIGSGGPLSAGVAPSAGGALVPYSAEAAAAANSPLIAAMRSAGIGTTPFVLPSAEGAIPMGAGAGATGTAAIDSLLARQVSALSSGAPINPALAESLVGGTGAAGAAGAVEGATPGLLSRMVGANLPSVSPGSLLGGRSLMGILKGTAPVVGEGGEVLAEGSAGLLNPWSIAPTLGAIGVNAVLPSSKPRQILADALSGAGAGAGIASVVPGVGTLFGAAVGGIGGALFGLLHNTNAAKPMSLEEGTAQINKVMDAAKLDKQARSEIMGQYQTAWATNAAQAKGGVLPNDAAKQLTQQATALVPQEYSTMVDRMAQQMETAQYLPQISQFMQPTVDRMMTQGQNTYNLANSLAGGIGGARGNYLRASALQQLQDVQNEARSYGLAAAFYPLMQQIANQAQNQASVGQSVDNSQLRKALLATAGTGGTGGSSTGGTGTASGTGTYTQALAKQLGG